MLVHLLTAIVKQRALFGDGFKLPFLNLGWLKPDSKGDACSLPHLLHLRRLLVNQGDLQEDKAIHGSQRAMGPGETWSWPVWSISGTLFSPQIGLPLSQWHNLFINLFVQRTCTVHLWGLRCGAGQRASLSERGGMGVCPVAFGCFLHLPLGQILQPVMVPWSVSVLLWKMDKGAIKRKRVLNNSYTISVWDSRWPHSSVGACTSIQRSISRLCSLFGQSQPASRALSSIPTLPKNSQRHLALGRNYFRVSRNVLGEQMDWDNFI